MNHLDNTTQSMHFCGVMFNGNSVLGAGIVGLIVRNRTTNPTTGAATDRWFHRLVLLGLLAGYGIGWSMMFPVVLLIVLAIFFPLLARIIDRLKSANAKRMALWGVAVTLAGFAIQKAGEYSLYKYLRDAPLDSYSMPSWAPAVSASAPSIWEKAIMDKVGKVREGRGRFPPDREGLGYSVGPDGINQGGLLEYDPTNGALSAGDIRFDALNMKN